MQWAEQLEPVRLPHQIASRPPMISPWYRHNKPNLNVGAVLAHRCHGRGKITIVRTHDCLLITSKKCTGNQISSKIHI